jgi:acetate---CoA ligase (ADP-forming)
VIGGGAWCANVVGQCAKIGFAGAVWPVHPTKAEVGGLPAVPRLADLPCAPDATFIGVNRQATVDMVAELAAMGAGGAVCFASGFREARRRRPTGGLAGPTGRSGGRDAASSGPTAMGFLNYLDGAALWPDQHGGQRGGAGRRHRHPVLEHRDQPDDAAARSAAGLCRDRRATRRRPASPRSATALLEDPRVTALGLHIEGIDDCAAFEAHGWNGNAPWQADRRAEDRGVRAGADSDRIAHRLARRVRRGARALLERLGIIQVDSCRCCSRR